MNFEKQIISNYANNSVMRTCNGSNDCGYDITFDKQKNTQVHGQNQKRDSSGGSCVS